MGSLSLGAGSSVSGWIPLRKVVEKDRARLCWMWRDVIDRACPDVIG